MAEIKSGLLHLNRGAGVLVDLDRLGDEVSVPARLVRELGLVEGARVTGPVQGGRRGPELVGVDAICGLSPEAFAARIPFDRLVALDPRERFPLAATGEPAMRIVDLVAPIGKGTRGLIVSPPKAGKTMLLEQVAQAVRATDPEVRIVVLLIDERPEEVTFFRRGLDAEVFASSADRPQREHVALAELMLAHIRVELECGHDVVVLLDSLTRMTRTFNLQGPGRGGGRSLSGGLEAGALQIPRRFFGVARNVENGGSVTILATILVDTGSRLDQVVFEEFKGTGNCEILLDRALAEARIFPAINVRGSGTRKDELLYPPDEFARLTKLRRALADRSPRDALLTLLQLIEKYPTNEELLGQISS
ncbi:MAG: transcription termination factor Rho [Anaerolineae bacterium]|jgi:transcription termination factor Rho|nr:transcription termination factor Rho [Anaerolineae bacterium]MDX9833318.1 transcription termination factor Rho [Anaerolineae bacterium]